MVVAAAVGLRAGASRIGRPSLLRQRVACKTPASWTASYVTQFGDLSLVDRRTRIDGRAWLKQHHVARLHQRDRAMLGPVRYHNERGFFDDGVWRRRHSLRLAR